MSSLTQSYATGTSLWNTWNTAFLAVQSSGRKDSHWMPAHLNLLSFSAISKMDSSCPLITHARYNIYNEPSNKERQLPDSHLAYLAHASLWALKQLNTRMDSTMGSEPAWPYASSPSPTYGRMQPPGQGNRARSRPTSRFTLYQIWDTTQLKLWKPKARTHLRSQGSCHRSPTIARGK